MKKYSFLIAIISLITAGLIIVVTPTFAKTNQNRISLSKTNWTSKGTGQAHRIPSVFGTVSAINGPIITITSKTGLKNKIKTTAYTIDATNAEVTKNNASSSLSSIAIGDTITAQGTMNGLNVTATKIRDGFGTTPKNKHKTSLKIP